MTNSDYVEVSGPSSLADLVAAIDSSAPTPTDRLTILELGGDVYASVQYDAVDADTWPYLVAVESRAEDEEPVRAAATRIMYAIKAAGWRFRMTSDADDSLLIESTLVP